MFVINEEQKEELEGWGGETLKDYVAITKSFKHTGVPTEDSYNFFHRIYSASHRSCLMPQQQRIWPPPLWQKKSRSKNNTGKRQEFSFRPGTKKVAHLF